jgi:histidine ammonia-lyase
MTIDTEPITLDTSVRLRALDADLDRRLAQLREDHDAGTGAVAASRRVVERAATDGQAHYGINTGFGALARTRIEADRLARLQRNLIVSHAVGVGPMIPRAVCRTMLRLKVHALGQGYSGVSEPTFGRLLDFAERDLIPAAPNRGSLGASGDLAPLAHLFLPLLGMGAFWNAEGTATRPAAEVLAEAGLEPIELGPKDGLALINGTQMMAAYACHALQRALVLQRAADVVMAMSLEALRGSARPFDARVHAVRPHPGQQTVAANLRALLQESEILESHRGCDKVQDPYSLRCVPQVHGASRDALAHAVAVVEREINSVTDNPLVFPDEGPDAGFGPAGHVVSGGNFHGQPLALVLDFAAIAVAELASISERRTYLLLDGHDDLPPLLMRASGVNSGFMMPQYTAAALVSENKSLCHPASVDSIPTSRGQEDHVSMGSIGALQLWQVVENAERVLAMELLCAAQGLDYRRPLRAGRGVEAAHAAVREQVEHREEDADFQADLAAALQLIKTEELSQAVQHSGTELQ